MIKTIASLVVIATLSVGASPAFAQSASPFDSSWKTLNVPELRNTPCEIGVRPTRGIVQKSLRSRDLPFGASGMMSDSFDQSPGLTLIFDQLSEYQTTAIGTKALAVGFLTESGDEELLMLCAGPTRVVYDRYDDWASIFGDQIFKG